MPENKVVFRRLRPRGRGEQEHAQGAVPIHEVSFRICGHECQGAVTTRHGRCKPGLASSAVTEVIRAHLFEHTHGGW